MAARDVEGASRVLMPEGRFFALRDGDDQSAPRTFTNEQDLKDLASRKQDVRERMWNPEVRIHGSIAVLWTPYDFWIDGKFSHCGVDAFRPRASEGWKIAGGVYTVKRTGCEPSPLGH
jgi:hypothetical protein